MFCPILKQIDKVQAMNEVQATSETNIKYALQFNYVEKFWSMSARGGQQARENE